MDITTGGATDSETSLDKIVPTINEIAETSETQSGVIKKVKAAGTIEQAHASLGMSFDTTPSTDILTPEESPLTKFCKSVQYEVIGEEEAGIVDDRHKDVYMGNETRRFLSTDLTPEVYRDIASVRNGLPPIGTAFFRVGEIIPTESPQPQSFPETEEIVPHDQI